MTKRLKILIIIAVIFGLIFIYVLYFSKSDKNEGKSVVLQSEPLISGVQNEQLSQAKDILSVLSLLKTINLNLDFFDNVSFKSLYDFSVQLPTSEVGKNNPFAP